MQIKVSGVTLKGPDQYGFLYERVPFRDYDVDLNVVPPRSLKSHWIGCWPLPSLEPHATKWIVLVNGEKRGEVNSPAEIDGAVKALDASPTVI